MNNSCRIEIKQYENKSGKRSLCGVYFDNHSARIDVVTKLRNEHTSPLLRIDEYIGHQNYSFEILPNP